MAGDPTLAFLAALDDPAQYRVTEDVPIWVPHVRREKNPDGTLREIRVTESDLPAYAEFINKLVSERGVVPRVTDGHLKPGQPPPKLLGYFCRARVGRFGPKGTPAVLVRRYTFTDPETQRIIGERPYRSPEVYTDAKEIRGLALLLNDPFLDMGNVTYDRGQLPVCYGGDAMPGDAIGAGSGQTPAGDAPQFTPEEEALFEKVCAYMRSKGYMKEPAADRPNPNDQKKSDDRPREPVTPMEKPITPEMYEAQQARIGELTSTLAGLQLERDQERCTALLYEALPRSEYRLSPEEAAKEVGRLTKLPAADRPERAKELKAIYADRKVPTGRLDLYQGHVEPQADADADNPHVGPWFHEPAMAYMRAHPGTQYEAACEYVQAQKAKQ